MYFVLAQLAIDLQVPGTLIPSTSIQVPGTLIPSTSTILYL